MSRRRKLSDVVPDVPPLRGCFAADDCPPPAWAARELAALPPALPCRIFGTPASVAPLGVSSPAEEPPARARADRGRSRDTKRRASELPVPVGAVVDKYRLDEVLGRGAFAVVYRATHLLLRSPVAIKMLLPSVVTANPRMAAMLCEEARLAARVDHPNVVRVRDVAKTETLSYIVMDYVEGEPLSRVLARDRRLAPERVVAIGLDCCAGLSSAERRGVIHRDVKPSNILIAADGSAKIIDLGLAFCGVDAGARHGRNGGLPADAIVGTPAYMSPEHVESPDSVDHRADIYSLGATLYHLACGETVFHARSVRELRDELTTAHVVPLAERVADVSPALSRVVARMLSRDRGERQQTYAELVSDLHTVRAELGVSARSRVAGPDSTST
ncbi:MAG: serine/threonine protein kinase [Planctomycetes bacterium]|nr:serine/threonine protein kinase [Planctomycetota bacterium]